MAYTGDPANNPLDAVRLEINDVDPVLPLLTDTEVQYFLDQAFGSVRKASMSAAKTILFKLSCYVRERAAEIEYYGSDYFKQYAEALKLYISNPEYGAVSVAMPYAGGISISDIKSNILNIDNYVVPVEKTIPTEGDGYNVNNNSPFTVSNLPRVDEFGL